MTSTSRRLKASPPGSVTWIHVERDGSLVVEFYDHSTEAEAGLGGDVAFLLRVAPRQTRPLLEALRGGPVEPRGAGEPASRVMRLLRWILHGRRADVDIKADMELLDELERRFGNYFEVKAWFDSAGIPYSHEFDPWA